MKFDPFIKIKINITPVVGDVHELATEGREVISTPISIRPSKTVVAINGPIRRNELAGSPPLW